MRFLADAGIARRIVESLAPRLMTQPISKSKGYSDYPIGKSSRRLPPRGGWSFMTFDLDFGEIVALSAPPSASVILFRLHDTSTTHVIERLEAVLEVSASQLEQGAVVVVVEETRHRVRAFPKEPQASE